MDKLIFLDVDGVLNRHRRHPNQFCGIEPECVFRLNRLVKETKADIVISSAWRYLILGGDMTCRGFENMLRTYGLCQEARVIDHTVSDEHTIGRGSQIQLKRLEFPQWTPYVVLDDGSDEPPVPPETKTLTESIMYFHAARWVRTKSDVGLTDEDVDKAIEILSR